MSDALVFDRATIRRALLDGIDWQESLRAANHPGTDEYRHCVELIAKYRRALKRLGDKPFSTKAAGWRRVVVKPGADP